MQVRGLGGVGFLLLQGFEFIERSKRIYNGSWGCMDTHFGNVRRKQNEGKRRIPSLDSKVEDGKIHLMRKCDLGSWKGIGRYRICNHLGS